jgi:predicted nucleotidyltransferase
VLELPFPFSISSAEFFARSGVYIANELKVVDILSFGSEIGDVDQLQKVALNMCKDEYRESISKLCLDDENEATGYAALCEKAYKECFGEELSCDIFSPNNILAIEYLKALNSFKSSIKPHTIKRCGAGYSESIINGTELQSATGIREFIHQGEISALEYVPYCTKNIYLDLVKEGSFPSDADKISSALISFLRLNPTLPNDIHDAQGGLYNRLRDKSFEANSISSLVSLSETKKYTKARIRRAMWNSFFGVTSSEIKELPKYTQLLAADKIGTQILKSIKKVSSFPVITKPSDYTELSDDVVRQKEKSVRAESVWTLSLPSPISGRFPLRFTPYVKK